MEESIKILEERIDYFKCHPEGCNWRLSFEDEKDIKALENLIKGYRELEEREIWSTATINGLKRDFIPKSKIKERIEEYKKLIKEVQDNEEHYNEIPLYEHDIEVLQELMEDK